MLRSTVLAIVLPAFASASFHSAVSQSSFEKLLAENELVLTAFTSPSLSSLQSFHEVYQKASKDSYTPFVTVDCEEEKDLCAEWDVGSWPALRLFKRREEQEELDGDKKRSEMIRYRGKKTARAIDSFITKYELPTLSHVEPKELKDFKNIDDVVILAYLRPDQDALVEVLRTVAERHRYEYVFGYVTDTAVADEEGLAMPAVVLNKNLDGDNVVLNGHFKEKDLEKLLEGAGSSVISEFKEKDVGNYMVKGKLTAYLFADSEESGTQTRKELTPLAKKYAQYVQFTVADAVEFGPMAKNYGLEEDKYPSLAVHAPMNDHIFRYRQGRKIEAESVEDMLKTILQAKAANGQVFGDDAPEIGAEREENVDEGKGHDEL